MITYFLRAGWSPDVAKPKVTIGDLDQSRFITEKRSVLLSHYWNKKLQQSHQIRFPYQLQRLVM